MIDIDLGIENMIDAEAIGQGGFADVYSATDKRLSRRVAVKVLRKNLAPSARRKFDRECEVMGRLSDHPHVVTVHSAGYTEHGLPYLVMELLDEGSLADRLDETGPVPWTEAIDYMIPIAEALSAAHQAGVLHRDIKPDNILLVGDQPRLTDFGIAQLQSVDNAITDDYDASWFHAAPETLEMERDERSDVYSIASTLYTLVAGQPPFWDPNGGSLMALVHRLVNDRPPTIDPDRCPPELAAFLERALAKDPASRPQTADELVCELRQLADGPEESAADPDRSRIARLLRGLQPLLLGAAAVVIGGVIAGLGLFGGGSDSGAEAEGRGSRQEPYPLGQSVTLFYRDLELDADREWSIQLLEPIVELTAVEPEPPSAELRLAMARIRITYLDGPAPARAAQLRLTATSDEGGRFALVTTSCGTTEERLDVDAELALDDPVEGRVCWWVPDDELSSIILAVEADGADGTVYLALD